MARKLPGVTAWLPASGTGTPSPSSGTPASTASIGRRQAGGFTLADVQQHASQESCWAVVDAKVYDLTNWIDRHPGGRAQIIALCGTDATTAFSSQHDSEREPEQQLDGLEIGLLR